MEKETKGRAMELRNGKISGAVRDRRIRNQGYRDVYEAIAVSGCIGGAFDRAPEMIAAEALARQAALGKTPKAAELTILLPVGTGEEELGGIIERTGRFIASENAVIRGISASALTGVTRPVLTVSAYPEENAADAGGKIKAADACSKPAAAAGEKTPLYAAGYAGEAGAAIAALSDKEAICTRFTGVIAERMVSGADRCLPSAALLSKSAQLARDGARIFAVGEGGIFAALYEMALQWDTGFSVDLKKIPIRQETVEICEFFDLNPYQLLSTGMFLAAVPEELIKNESLFGEDGGLPGEGVRFTKIGTLAKAPKKEIVNGEEIRFLEKPQQDMLRVLEDRKKQV